MQIQTNKQENTLTVKIIGRIDTITSPVLEKQIKQDFTPEIEEIIFDFQEVEYMSSAGIRVIMATDKAISKQGQMKLINVNEEIMEIFEITGLSDILEIE